MLREAFQQTGDVVNVDVKKDKVTKNNLGYGFVEFKVWATVSSPMFSTPDSFTLTLVLRIDA
jgi:hypothetical protein